MNALEVVQRMFERTAAERSRIEHQVLADEATRIREPIGKPRGLRHQQQPRRFRTVAAHDDGLGPLEHLALLRVEVYGAVRAAAFIRLDLAHLASGANFALARALCHRDDTRERTRFRANLAAIAFAKAALQAGVAPAIRARKDRHRRRKRMQAEFSGSGGSGYGFERGGSNGLAPASPDMPRSSSAFV